MLVAVTGAFSRRHRLVVAKATVILPGERRVVPNRVRCMFPQRLASASRQFRKVVSDNPCPAPCRKGVDYRRKAVHRTNAGTLHVNDIHVYASGGLAAHGGILTLPVENGFHGVPQIDPARPL